MLPQIGGMSGRNLLKDWSLWTPGNSMPGASVWISAVEKAQGFSWAQNCHALIDSLLLPDANISASGLDYRQERGSSFLECVAALAKRAARMNYKHKPTILANLWL